MTIAQLHQLFSSNKAKELYGRYITLKQIEPLMKNFPKKFELQILGYSIQKKPLYRLKIGSGSIKILLWSQMHGNESTTTKALFDVLNVFDNSKDSSIVKILESCSFLIIPILNPDGAEAYTRENANHIDLNRDAQQLSQAESKVLRQVFDDFNPDFCFNLHGQRSIFGVGHSKNPAILSFLAPAQDVEFSISNNRKIAMDIIGRIHSALQIVIPDQIGIYDDSFNLDCVGDTFQSLGIPTLLFEAGHFPEDYQRETTRELIFKALLLAFDLISNTDDLGIYHKFYFQIPPNQKCFRDLIIRHAIVNGETIDIAIQYKEVLNNNTIDFIPIIDCIESSLKLFGHREIDAQFTKIKLSSELKVGNEIDFAVINNEKFSLFA